MSDFTSQPGQVDYTNIRWAPVINCVCRYSDKILIVQRSAELNFYPEYWNGVSGFLDDDRDFEEHVTKEIEEETGITKKDIENIKRGKIFHKNEPKYNKTWIVHPVLVDVKHKEAKLDREAQDYKWINPEEVFQYNLMPGFDRVVEILFNLNH